MNPPNKIVDMLISPVNGPVDPPPISITFKIGRRSLIRVEVTTDNFALALTGRIVKGTITGGEIE